MLSGKIRQLPEYFVVDERLGFTLAGSGEHHNLKIEKSNLNTTEIAEKLAKFSGVPLRCVSYSGLKDKRAVTTQWFSVHLPGKPLQAIHWEGIESLDWRDGHVRLIRCCLHNRKLRRGAHNANVFRVTVRNLEVHSQSRDADNLGALLIKRAAQVTEQGFPNYYGEQRFGFGGSNLDKALALLNHSTKVSRHKKSLYLSSVRSFLFNQLLNERIKLENWNGYQQHDRLVLNGSNSFFTPAADDSSDEMHSVGKRLKRGDIHIGGVLFGQVKASGNKNQTLQYNRLERDIIERFPQLNALLEKHRLERAVRPLRAMVCGLSAEMNQDCDRFTLEFSLPAGCYATALLREFGVFSADRV